jgi:hypothetical protein
MSGKNRAFALAVATAALVGVSAPVAHAASGPSGFNNDSLLNVSGNQVPIQACNNNIPVNAGVLAGQLPLSDISALLGLVNTGNQSSSVSRDCSQTPAQSTTSTTTTGNTTSTGTSTGTGTGTGTKAPVSHGPKGTSGFNNDSLVNASNNQIPVQLCNNDIPVNAGLGVVQLPVDGVSAALGLLSTGSVTSTVTRHCDQKPSQTNSSTTTTGNTVTNG